MAEVTLDIATKIVSPDQHIWSVFPGLNRRFLSQFFAEGVIFLDLPGINLTPQSLTDDKLLRQHVAMSQAWRAYHLGKTEKLPSRRSADYSENHGASLNAAVGNAKNVFIRMRPNDLVLVGRQSLYEPILIGEIEGSFDPDTFVYVDRYGHEKLPVRRVRWLPVQVERRLLSQSLSHLLSNRKAVVGVDKGTFGDEIYKFAYGDYVFGENSRYIFEGPKYNNIAISTVPGIHLISYFSAAFNAYEEGELEAFSKLSIHKAIDNYFEQDVLYSFEIDFSSPGEYILYAKRAVLPLLVAVLVSATDGNISTIQQARAVEIMNSAASAQAVAASTSDVVDSCTVEIQEKYRAIMNSINADRFNELCRLNRDARDGVGLKVRVKKQTIKKK